MTWEDVSSSRRLTLRGEHLHVFDLYLQVFENRFETCIVMVKTCIVMNSHPTFEYSCRGRGGHPVVTGTLDTLTKKLDLPLRHTRWPWLPLRACRLLRRFEPADEAGCAALACYPRQHTRGRVFRAARPRRQRFCSISSAPNVDGEGQQVRSCP